MSKIKQAPGFRGVITKDAIRVSPFVITFAKTLEDGRGEITVLTTQRNLFSEGDKYHFYDSYTAYGEWEYVRSRKRAVPYSSEVVMRTTMPIVDENGDRVEDWEKDLNRMDGFIILIENRYDKLFE